MFGHEKTGKVGKDGREREVFWVKEQEKFLKGGSRKVQWLSESKQAQGKIGFGGHLPEGFGNVCPSGVTQEADGEISEGSHDAGSISGSNLGAIFIKGDIPDIIQAILDRPVAPVELQEAAGQSFLRGEAGDPVDCLFASLTALHFGELSLDAEDLADVRKLKVVIQLSTGPDPANFQTAMTFIDGFVLRGEKRFGEALRYPS